MNAIDLFVIGVCTAFNFIVLIHKYRLKRYMDACIDMCIFICICFLFSNSFNALVAGTVASMFVSFYLYFKPVTLVEFTRTEDEYD
jgi:hypothetical protein